MGKIITKNGFFSFEEIKNNNISLPDGYDQNALIFCKEWLNGKQQFTLQTSGSTGTPKPITITRRQMEASALATIEALQLEAGSTSLVCLNVSYIAGVMMLVRGLVGNHTIILTAPDTHPLKNLSDLISIDYTAMVPMQLQATLDKNDPDEMDILKKVKVILLGGAAVSGELESKLNQLTPTIINTYGMTETVSHIALRKINGNNKQQFFQVLPGVSIDLNEQDCLKIKAPVTNDQWIQTTDRVEIIAPDKFIWLGRADYIINSGGVKIQPEKIERLLESFFSDKKNNAFFIGGLPHPQLGEAVTLFIEGTEPATEDWLSLLRPYIQDRYEIPKGIVWINEFPKTVTGKTERTKVIEKYKDFYFSR